MGLDMWLEKKKKNDAEAKYEEVAYWRKANQIREWFCEHVGGIDNCVRVQVDEEDLQKLMDDCIAVLSDHNKAKELLPTSPGFFFGSYEYDEWYFEQIKETIEMLEEVLHSKVDWDTEEVFYFEWW